MIYLLPFVTAFILYVTFVQGQPFNGAYVYFMETIVPKFEEKTKIGIPDWLMKMLGACTLCFAGQIGMWSLILIYLIKIYFLDIDIKFTGYWLIKEIGTFIFLICYNAVAAVFLFKQSLSMPSQVAPKHVPITTKEHTK